MTLKVPKPQSSGGAFAELVIIVALALGLALAIQAFVVKPYQIPSGSMQPTLQIDQRVLVNRFVYRFADPKIGDIVVFHPPAGAEEGSSEPKCVEPQEGAPCAKGSDEEAESNFIKRIVAGPGDTIAVEDGHPVVNGEVQSDEDFINQCGTTPACQLPNPITVPEDHYFMMGDNRVVGGSEDSRYWGPVPRDWIIGKAFATYWPPKRIGLF